MSSSRTSADKGKSSGPEEMRVGRWEVEEVKGQERNVVEKIERRNCALGVDCVLTHCSPGEEGVGAPAAQAGVGPSPRPVPVSGEPSLTCGSHQLSSLLGRWKMRRVRTESKWRTR